MARRYAEVLIRDGLVKDQAELDALAADLVALHEHPGRCAPRVALRRGSFDHRSGHQARRTAQLAGPAGAEVAAVIPLQRFRGGLCLNWLGGIFENPDCHRCLGAPGQRRRAHAQDHGARTDSDGSRGAVPHAARIPHAALPDLSRDPPVAVSAGRREPARFANSIPTCCTSPPKGRSAWRRGASRCATISRSPRPITRASPNTCTRASGCRCRGVMPGCGTFTGPRRA